MELEVFSLVPAPLYFQMKRFKMIEKRPIPITDSDSDIYWKKAKEKKLYVQHCKTTNQYFLYSRQLISQIDETNVEWVEVSGKGTIYSFTIVYVPAGELFKDKIPYIVGSILLIEGARLISNIIFEDPNKIYIGQKVEVIYQNFENNLTIPMFKPIES